MAELLVGRLKENAIRMSSLGRTTLNVALGALAALMVPLVASRLIPDWNWPVQGFILTYILFFITGMIYAFISRKMGAWSYKAGVGLALLAGFALGWSNMVHTADAGNPALLIYYSVLVVGAAGVCLARLRPRGLARTLFAMAVLMAAISLSLPSGAPPELARNMAIGHTVLVVMFVASGLLFRHASAAGMQ